MDVYDENDNNNNIDNENENENENENNSQNNSNTKNNKNVVEKPLHGQMSNSFNASGSVNPMDNENNEIINISKPSFSFLNPKGDTKILTNNKEEIQEVFRDLNSNCKYAICILIKDDTYFNSSLLEITLKELINNIKTLNKLLINPENVLIFLFFNEIKGSSIYSEEDFTRLKENSHYILSQKSFKNENENEDIDINIHCISKKNYFSDIEILQFYYTYIISQLINDTSIFSSIITSGVFPYSNSIENLIKLSCNGKKNSIVVPCLEEHDDNTLMGKIKKYERIHFNLYNMNFYDMTASVPICSLLNTMTIDNALSQHLVNFYNDIKLDQSIDYHDYSLSLYLFRKNYKIIYYNSLPLGCIKYSELKEDPICDYKDYWVKRYSGYYGNFFNIVNSFLDCNAFDFAKKCFQFFHILGLMIEFIFPSLSCMVIYTIFYEAFNTYDQRPSVFCTLLYLFMLVCSGACSLISNNSHKMRITHLYLYIFMEVYYLFILICSIIAMDNVKKNKNQDPYKFNTAAIVFIIILTFIPGISPMLIKISTIFDNILPLLFYLVLGAPSSSSIFYIAKILNAGETSGGRDNIKEKKGIIILCYFLSNLFFGSLTFFNYNRQTRVDAVMGLGIFYLIYNFFKAVSILINLLTNNKNLIISNNIVERDIEINQDQSNYSSKKKPNNNSINNFQSTNQDYQQNSQIYNNDNDNENNNQEYNQSREDVQNNHNNSNNDDEYPSKSQVENKNEENDHENENNINNDNDNNDNNDNDE